jgi:hypothetical protein
MMTFYAHDIVMFFHNDDHAAGAGVGAFAGVDLPKTGAPW